MRTKKVTKKRAGSPPVKTVSDAKIQMQRHADSYRRGTMDYYLCENEDLDLGETAIMLKGIRRLVLKELRETDRALLCKEIINSLTPVYLAAIMADVASGALGEITVGGSLLDREDEDDDFEEEPL